MKFVFGSKFYYRRGGLEAYMFKTTKLLQDRGHDVIPFSTLYNENIASEYDECFCDYVDLSAISKIDIIGNLKAFKNMFFNKNAYLMLCNLILWRKPLCPL